MPEQTNDKTSRIIIWGSEVDGWFKWQLVGANGRVILAGHRGYQEEFDSMRQVRTHIRSVMRALGVRKVPPIEVQR